MPTFDEMLADWVPGPELSKLSEDEWLWEAHLYVEAKMDAAKAREDEWLEQAHLAVDEQRGGGRPRKTFNEDLADWIAEHGELVVEDDDFTAPAPTPPRASESIRSLAQAATFPA